jgi:RNA polymerase sigma-70 factor (ECF subfamily)
MLGNMSDAEDAVQDAWIRALHAFHRYDRTRPFRPWIFRILVNTVRSHLRTRNRWWNRWSESTDPDTLAGPAGEVENDAQLDALRAAVAELPDTLREAFLLKYVSNMSYPDIEQATGASVPALKMRVKRACDALRRELTEVQGDDDE